ncbi:MAG: ribonuclease domain-containing protein [Burkholderiaceae bacterium]|nr:ribonuclease domain-containing protein [Burkholderiaceae bacterium]
MNTLFFRKWSLFLLAALFSVAVQARGLVGDIPAAQLPPEARQTLVLIKSGGPFPYAKDGAVFGNYEGAVPKRKRGYYHEYTVKTARARDRGARRIIAGGQSQISGEYYYTADHYETFRLIRE